VRHFNSAVLPFAFLAVLSAQETASISPIASSSVPRLIRFGSSFKPANGLPPQPTEGATLSIYREEQGGAPLWQETQNVTVGAEGRYNLLLGSTMTDGLPMELFTAGEPRWLGVTFNRPGEVEQPRVRLASVPYALKAVDAETLGGIPASAYLRDPAAASSTTAAIGTSTGTSAPTAGTNAVSGKSLKPHATSGTTNYLGVFTSATDLGNSNIYQSGSNLIGVNTTRPFDFFHVSVNDTSGTFTGYAVQNTTSLGYSGMQFYDQPGNVSVFQGFNNLTHEYRINNVASGGSINFMIGGSPKLYVANTGNIGIGTTAPGAPLDVAGDLNLSGNLMFRGSVGLQLSLLASNHDLAVGTVLPVGTPGFSNTAIGSAALVQNNGSWNTAVGHFALNNNQSGFANTAVGYSALADDGPGNNDTAVGYLAGLAGGYSNVAVGSEALRNAGGAGNTAVGAFAAHGLSAGDSTTAIGYRALMNLSSGQNNTVIGAGALENLENGSNNIAIGTLAALNVGINNSNNIHIGTQGAFADANTIRIGGGTSNLNDAAIQTSFFATAIRGVTTGMNNAIPVLIDSNGQLGTVSSSRRFKSDIQDMGEASSGLMRLRPVTFRYKKPFEDGLRPIQYGLIAEEVAEVYPDLVARSADGEIETVKYQVLPTMLLNEVQRQEVEINSLKKQVEKLRALEQQNQSLQERLAKLEAALSSNGGANQR
jgi:hypothetical protein